jgi:YbbR domain-containing protein
VSSNLEITNSPVSEVDLVITGDKRRIEQIFSENLVVSVDLTEAGAGEQLIQLTPENVNIELPTGVKLDEIQPNRIALRLENVLERDVPVKPEIEGAVAEGFEIYSVAALPSKVRLRGPESFVKSLDSISTEKINVENARGDFTAHQVQLNVVNPKVTLLDTVVDVVFKIGERRIERLFTIPVQTESESKRATIILYGARSVLENLQQENLQIEMLKNEAGQEIPRLILPPELQDKVEIRRLKLY